MAFLVSWRQWDHENAVWLDRTAVRENRLECLILAGQLDQIGTAENDPSAVEDVRWHILREEEE